MGKPVLNGKETLIKIKCHDHLNDIPVVLFTTSSDPSEKTFARNWNSDLFTKPIIYKDLDEIATQFVIKCNFELNKISDNESRNDDIIMETIY